MPTHTRETHDTTTALLGRRFCRVTAGVIDAVVLWDQHEHEDAVVDEVYAVDGSYRKVLPAFDDVGAEITRMRDSGELVEFGPLVRNLDGCYRVDDRRADPDGAGGSYLVWLGNRRGPTQADFKQRTVYRFFAEAYDDVSPPVSFEHVLSLIHHPDALRLDDVRGMGTWVGDNSTRQAIDVRGRVTVWDLGEIERNLRK